MAPSSSVRLLLGLLSAAAAACAALLPPPRTSYPLNSSHRPLFHFSLPDVQNTTTLLLSNDGATLFVGAQDTLLSLDISRDDAITLRRKVEWRPSQRHIDSCQLKGKNPTRDCPNFIRVLQPINSTHLYACGSFAYSPHDAYIDMETLTVEQHEGAKGRCPFSPYQRNTAITIDGELFTATTNDFRGVMPLISRHLSKDGRPDVSQDTISLLEDPTFIGVSSDPEERKLYFFFSEVGKEFSFVDELKIARVAQVCKDDVGGQRTLQKKWTSFAKAPLLCQAHKQLPFNVLQDIFTLQPPEGAAAAAAHTLFYGVFTSQWSRGAESAVCAFTLADFRRVFAGSYRVFNRQTHQWSPLLETHSHLGKCGLENASNAELNIVKTSFLTSESVRAEGGTPVLVSSQHSYSRVVAMTTPGANGRQYRVLFLLTEDGFLHKVALLDGGAQVVEEIQVFTGGEPFKNLVLSPSRGALYVGTSQGVTAVPVARCSAHSTCKRCVLARDPFCGWSRTRKLCVRLDGSDANVAQVLENGSVEEECRDQSEPSTVKDVYVHLNEVVNLSCGTTPGQTSVTWTSSRDKVLPERLFMQSPAGRLCFVATSDTMATYRCEASEGGVTETVAGFRVQQAAPPRSMSHPRPSEEEEAETIPPLQGEEDREHGVTSSAPDQEEFGITTARVPPRGTTRGIEGPTPDEPALMVPPAGCRGDDTSTSKQDAHNDLQSVPARSYYGELVAVSLMLVLCLAALMLLLWRQRKPGPKRHHAMDPEGGSEATPTEEDASLSSPELKEGEE